MKNHIQPGNVITLTAPYDVNSGDGLLVGALFGVASAAALSGVAVEAAMTGVYTLPTADAFTQGALAYWDDVAKDVTTTSAGNTLIGHAIAATGGTSVNVRLSI